MNRYAIKTMSTFLLLLLICKPWILNAQNDSLLFELNRLDSDVKKIDLLNKILHQSIENETPLTDTLIRMHEALIKRQNNIDAEIVWATQLCNYYYVQYQDSIGLSMLKPYMTHLDQVSDPVIQAKAHYIYALVNRVFGNFDLTNASLKHAISIFENLGDSSQERFGDAYREAGATYMSEGNFAESALLLNKSLELFKYNQDSAGLRGSLLDLFILFSQIGLYDEANKYMEARSQYMSATTPSYELVIGSINAGRNALLAEDWNIAIAHYKSVIDSVEVFQKIYLLNGLIEAFYFSDQTDSIPQYFREMEKSFEAVNRSDQFYFLFQQSRFLYRLALGNYALAELDGRELLNNSIEKGDVAEIMMHNRFMAVLYEKNGDYKRALKYTQDYLITKDSMVAANKASALLLYQTLHETKEKESEIQQLNLNSSLFQTRIEKDRLLKVLLLCGMGILLMGGWILFSQFRSRQRAKIQDVRTNISSDLHDEVGSLLSGISMQADMLSVVPEHKKSEFLSNIRSNVHRASETMRDLVWSIDSRRDKINDFKDKITETCLELLASKGLMYTVQIGDQVDGLKKLNPRTKKELYLICREAFNNILKHSNGDAVDVQLRLEHTNLVLKIQDNGTNDNANLPSSGQGLDNIRKRAADLGGTAHIQKTPAGFIVRVSAPV